MTFAAARVSPGGFGLLARTKPCRNSISCGRSSSIQPRRSSRSDGISILPVRFLSVRGSGLTRRHSPRDCFPPQGRGDIHVDIDEFDANLCRAVPGAEMPVAILQANIPNLRQKEATPFAARWQTTRAALTAELIGQHDFPATGPAENMRTELAMMALIAADDLLALENGPTEVFIGATVHSQPCQYALWRLKLKDTLYRIASVALKARRRAQTIGTVTRATQATTAIVGTRPTASPSSPNRNGPPAPATEPPV